MPIQFESHHVIICSTYKAIPIHVRFSSKTRGNIGSWMSLLLPTNHSHTINPIQLKPDIVKRHTVAAEDHVKTVETSSNAVMTRTEALKSKKAPTKSTLFSKDCQGTVADDVGDPWYGNFPGSKKITNPSMIVVPKTLFLILVKWNEVVIKCVLQKEYPSPRRSGINCTTY